MRLNVLSKTAAWPHHVHQHRSAYDLGGPWPQAVSGLTSQLPNRSYQTAALHRRPAAGRGSAALRVDTLLGWALISAVHFLHRITAVLLLALWLPATAHCRLEAAGADLGSSCCAKETPLASEDECNNDICSGLEGRSTDPAAAAVGVSAPVLSACVFVSPPLPALPPCSAPPGFVPEESTAPPELVRSHHFVDRTALPARSPDCAS